MAIPAINDVEHEGNQMRRLSTQERPGDGASESADGCT